MKKITEIAHDCLKEITGEIAVDFTCGNGFDTYFFASHFKKVYAFDIQKMAILNTKEKCMQFNHIEYILDSHTHVDRYVSSFDVGMFNCGYLPHGDESITTNGEEVISALEKALPLLNKKGRLVLVLYPGFEQGEIEANKVENYTMKLSGKIYDVCKIQILNRNKAPYILIIDKK